MRPEMRKIIVFDDSVFEEGDTVMVTEDGITQKGKIDRIMDDCFVLRRFYDSNIVIIYRNVDDIVPYFSESGL